MSTRLVKTHARYYTATLDDFLSAVCGTIEDAFLTNGATPGKDYSHLDLMTLAMNFATNAKNGTADELSFTSGWPDSPSVSANATEEQQA